MKNIRLKNMRSMIFIGILLLGMIGSILLPDKLVSETERRTLTQFPEETWNYIFENEYSDTLETYFLDQFIFRDFLRTIKSEFDTHVFGKTDSNGYVDINGSIFKIQTTYDENQIYQAGEKFQDITSSYFQDAKIYYSIIPDKNYFVDSLPTYDYERAYQIMGETFTLGQSIDVKDELELNDYYNTDLHARQEELLPLANQLLLGMGIEEGVKEDYEKILATNEFYGGYSANSAYLTEPDELYYLENTTIENAIVYDYESDLVGGIYTLDKLGGMDDYDIFLGGARALLTIENSQENSGKKLIVFRDSFGSSIAPLLLSGYEEITLVDLRYVSVEYAMNLLGDKEYDDVLFLYQVEVLYNSNSMKK